MALANCISCGRLFNRIHREICPECVKLEEQEFFDVREYLKEHRRASTHEVSEATGVEMKKLIKWIREGRLATLDNPNMNFPCEVCMTPITDGRFCRSCKDRLGEQLERTKQDLSASRPQDKHRGPDYYHKRDR